jgi:hypothetical protein
MKPHDPGNTVLPTGNTIFLKLFRNPRAAVSPAAHLMSFFDLFEQAFILLLPKPLGTPSPCVIPAP